MSGGSIRLEDPVTRTPDARDPDPDFATLADWVDGRLAAPQAAAVAARVAAAGSATRAAVDWLRAFRELTARPVLVAPPEEVRERIVGLFVPRLPPAVDVEVVRAVLRWDSSREPGLAGARAGGGVASSGVRSLLFDAAGIDVTLDLYPVGDDRWRVEGQVLPPADVIAPVSAVQLVRGRRGVADAVLDDLGAFVLEGIDPDRYELLLLGRSLQIEVPVDLQADPRP